MLNVNEQFAELSRNSIQSTLRFTTVALEGAEHLARLHLDLAKRTLEENVRVVAAANDPAKWQEAVTARTTQLTESSLENVLDYARNVYDVVSQTQGELLKLMEEGWSRSKDTLRAMEQEVQPAADGSLDFASAAFKSTMATTAAAMEGMTQAAKQMAEYTAGSAPKTRVPAPVARAETSARKAAPAHH